VPDAGDDATTVGIDFEIDFLGLELDDRFADFDALTTGWNALTLAMNSLNRSMGMKDAYPFVLTPPVLGKLRFVHALVAAQAEQAKPALLRPAA